MPEFRPVSECFELSDNIRASHLLWEDFLQERTDIKGNVRYKIAFYTWLQNNEIGAKRGKDEKGNFGFGLKFIPRRKPGKPELITEKEK